MGRIAQVGQHHETVLPWAGEVLDRAPDVLAAWGFAPAPLSIFQERLDSGRVPADDLLDLYERAGSIEGVLRHLSNLIPAESLPAGAVG